MKSPPRRNLEVFDFKVEDEVSELVDSRFLVQIANPSKLDFDDGIIKYKFLECVAQGNDTQLREIENPPCVDVDAVDTDYYRNEEETLASGEEDFTTKEPMSELDAVAHTNHDHEVDTRSRLDNPDSESISPVTKTRASIPEPPHSHESSQSNFALLESPPRNEQLDEFSDADESSEEESSPLSSASDIAEDDVSLDGKASDHCFGVWQKDDINTEVVICPDFVEYRDKYCTGLLLSFSSSCIKIKGPTAYGNHGTFSFQWGVDDIVNIESQWSVRTELAIVKLRVISKDAVSAESGCGISGIEELNFTVVDPDWCEKQEKITLLDVRYKAIWNIVLDTNRGRDENDTPFLEHYFPKFDKPFEDVIYPKGDPDAVSISKRDVELLQPDTFINDTIIDFYIKYLKNKIEPEEKHRFHFFNSFFFRKLADLDKDPTSASQGRVAYQRVRKWTRKVNLFEKDFIFIPVNFNLHWSLIVICHPSEVINFEEENRNNAIRVPCILHMDSIKGSHSGLKNLVQSYLWEEWKERQKETCEAISSKFFNMRFVSLELPQQENSFDCGLFLLHYVELFLEEAPVNFNPFKIAKYSDFLNADWFLPSEASLKRAFIQKIISELLQNDSQEISQPAACSNEPPNPSKCPEKSHENETGIEIISEKCSPAKACNSISSCSGVGHGIEMTLLETSSMRSYECANSDPGLVLREFLEPEAAPESFINGQYRSFEQTVPFHHYNGNLTTIEEDPDTGEQFMSSPSKENDFQGLGRLTSFSSRDFRDGTSWGPRISLQHEEVSSPETSTSDGSVEVEVHENPQLVGEDIEMIETAECEAENSPLDTDAIPETSVVEDSLDPDKIHDNDANGEPVPSQENSVESDPKDSKGNKSVANDVELVGKTRVPEENEEQPVKRLRLAYAIEGERRLTRSVSKDFRL